MPSILSVMWMLLLPAAALASPSRLNARERAFADTCTAAFDRSSGNGSGGVGRKICECTARESRNEGVSREALQRETARIGEDPKNKIQDQRLLNALHYCSIEMLH